MSNEIQNLGSVWLPLYKDSLQPSVQEAGRALGQVTSLILNPIGKCAEIAEKNAMKFLNKFDINEKDDIVPPATGIAVPILQILSYTEEDELVEMYCELLKKSCLKNHKGKVLSSYAKIISRLTPDEANIVNFFFRELYTVELPLRSIEKHAILIKEHDTKVEASHVATVYPDNENKVLARFFSIPFLEIRSRGISPKSWWTVIKYFTEIRDRVALQNPENVELYIDNLSALGVIEVKNDFLRPKKIYNHLKENKKIISIKKDIEKQKREMVLKRKTILFTNLGNSLLEACTSKQQTPPVTPQ